MTLQDAIQDWWSRIDRIVRAHPAFFFVALIFGLTVIALWSRYRFIIGDYTYTFGSGDAHLILLKALMLHEGVLVPSSELVPTPSAFDQPPLVPLTLAGLSAITPMSLHTIPLLVVPMLTTISLLAFFDLIRRTFNLPTAALATLLLALLPYYSFASTEPDKGPFVVSFAIIAMWLLVRSDDRSYLLPLAGLFLGLAAFAHTTGYFFIAIFTLSYFALRGVSRRTALDRGFLAAIAMPICFIGLYAGLSHAFQSEAGSGDAAVEAGVLPSFVQTYIDAFTSLAKGGFRDSAWNLYFEGIRHQISTPAYVMAIAGLLIALWSIVRQGRTTYAPIVLWVLIIAFGFAIQFPAASHGSRYPLYALPAFIAMAAFAVVTLAQFALQRVSSNLLAAAVLSCAIAAPVWLTFDYATASNPGTRDLYGGYRSVAEYIAEERLLDDGSHLLYLGWPTITYHILDEDIGKQEQLHSFGFGLRDLDEFTPEFIEANNIRYFIHARAGNDGNDSSNIVLAKLQADFQLTLLGRFERREGNYAELYRIDRTTPESQASTRAALELQAPLLAEASLLANPLLQEAGDSFAPWEANGRVELEQLGVNNDFGVRVRNAYPYGGVKQVIPAHALRGRTVTAIAIVQGIGSRPAHSAVLALAEEGERPFTQTFYPLSSGEFIMTLETEIPNDVELLQLSIATGSDDSGDIAIAGVYLLPATLDSIFASRLDNIRFATLAER